MAAAVAVIAVDAQCLVTVEVMMISWAVHQTAVFHLVTVSWMSVMSRILPVCKKKVRILIYFCLAYLFIILCNGQKVISFLSLLPDFLLVMIWNSSIFISLVTSVVTQNKCFILMQAKIVFCAVEMSDCCRSGQHNLYECSFTAIVNTIETGRKLETVELKLCIILNCLAVWIATVIQSFKYYMLH